MFLGTVVPTGGFIGRETELAELDRLMACAVSGSGAAVMVSGEAGIGKTRLVDEFIRRAAGRGVCALRGQTTSDSGQPFLVFSSALDMTEPLFQETESVSFAALFAVNNAGLLVAQSMSGTDGAMDPDIFAGMLSAVQNFVRDSFDSSGTMQGSLGRLEYGRMKIIIKHGDDLFLAAVLSDQEHPDMEGALKLAVDTIEAEHGNVLRHWSGRMQEAAGIQARIDLLSDRKFHIRRTLAGLKLENERMRIAHMVFEKLSALGAERPVLLVLEDLHWADESSLAVLGYLARNIGQERILLVGTCRPSESKAMASALEKMRKEGSIEDLRLDNLGREDVKGLVDAMLSPNGLPPEFIETVATRCVGNPFFVTETVKHMARDGSIGLVDARYMILREDYAIPDTVEEVVQSRLESLDSDVMAMAEYASCIGTYFDRETALSIPSLKDPAAALDGLSADGIIITREDSSFFCHAIFRDVTYRSIGDRWKLAYHKSIGEHFERSLKGRDDELLYELARHFFRSSDKKKAYSYCMNAADLAEASFAPEQAVSFLKDALSLVLARKPAGEPAAIAELSERIADLAELMGDYDLAIDKLRSIIDLQADAEIRARALRKVAHLLEMRGKYEEGLETVARAKELNGDVKNREAAMIVMAEASIYEARRELDRAVGMQRQALAAIEEADPGSREGARIYSRIGTCLWLRNEFDQALECFKSSLAISEAHKDLRGIASAMNNIGIVYIRKGDYNSAAEYLRKARDIYQRIGDQNGIASSSGNLGNVCSAKGDFEGAMAAYNICLKVFTRLGARMALGSTVMNMGAVYEHLGEYGKAMESYIRSKEIWEELGEKRGMGTTTLNIGNLYYDMGDYEAALREFDASKVILEELGERNAITHALNGLVKARIKLGKLDGCREMIDRALQLSKDMGMAENEAAARTLSGRLHTIAGNLEAAEDALNGSVDYCRSGGYNKFLADALWARGELRAAMKDRPGARKDLDEARELLVGMHQEHLAKRIDEDVARLGLSGGG